MKDANGDGRLDIATGWEEGGVIRVYLHPGRKKVRGRWPAVTVGRVNSPEDAVFVDCDGDGALDVVSSCEGRTRSMYVHWAPNRPEHYLDASKWKTQAITDVQGKQPWMFALGMQVDHRHGIDLICASKNPAASIGWLQAPANARDMDKWKYRKLYDASWIMSLQTVDLDKDGDMDVLASDRKGATAGILWLENPGATSAENDWAIHRLGESGRQIMFLDVADLDGDGDQDVIAAVRPTDIVMLLNPGGPKRNWTSQTVTLPPVGIGTAKAVCVGDINLDGKLDIVFSCEQATGNRQGMFWLSYTDSITSGKWDLHAMSGTAGVKFDRIELVDLDDDGDLDAICCEERDQLGVFWYENPTSKESRNR